MPMSRKKTPKRRYKRRGGNNPNMLNTTSRTQTSDSEIDIERTPFTPARISTAPLRIPSDVSQERMQALEQRIRERRRNNASNGNSDDELIPIRPITEDNDDGLMMPPAVPRQTNMLNNMTNAVSGATQAATGLFNNLVDTVNNIVDSGSQNNNQTGGKKRRYKKKTGKKHTRKMLKKTGKKYSKKSKTRKSSKRSSRK